jgi:basic membrane protein A and related proteins
MKRLIYAGLTIAMCLSLVAAQRMNSLGIVYNAADKMDRSFNQRAFEGANRASMSYNIGLLEYEPSSPEQIEAGVRELSEAGMGLIIAVGFSSEPAVTKVAKSFPQTKYAVLDSVPTGGNTLGLVFREEEGSYVVGYIAGRSTSTGVVGFVGGMNIPLIHKFELGFTAGVKAACPSCTVLAEYIADDPSAWNNPTRASQISAQFTKQGADIIYAAAGGSGTGVIDYIKKTKCLKASSLPKNVKFRSTNISANVPKETVYAKTCGTNSRPMFFIGVDYNQNSLGDNDATPRTMNYVLTSMEKRSDNVVYKLLTELNTGGVWKSGVRDFGLREEGVGFSVDAYNKALISKDLLTQVGKVKSDIILGKIKIPKVK